MFVAKYDSEKAIESAIMPSVVRCPDAILAEG